MGRFQRHCRCYLSEILRSLLPHFTFSANFYTSLYHWKVIIEIIKLRIFHSYLITWNRFFLFYRIHFYSFWDEKWAQIQQKNSGFRSFDWGRVNKEPKRTFKGPKTDSRTGQTAWLEWETGRALDSPQDTTE